MRKLDLLLQGVAKCLSSDGQRCARGPGKTELLRRLRNEGPRNDWKVPVEVGIKTADDRNAQPMRDIGAGGTVGVGFDLHHRLDARLLEDLIERHAVRPLPTNENERNVAQVLDRDFGKLGQRVILPDHADAFAGGNTLDIDARSDLTFHTQETKIDHPLANQLVDGSGRFEKSLDTHTGEIPDIVDQHGGREILPHAARQADADNFGTGRTIAQIFGVAGHAVDGKQHIFRVPGKKRRLRRRDQPPLVTGKQRQRQVRLELRQKPADTGLAEPHGLGGGDGRAGGQKRAQDFELLDIHEASTMDERRAGFGSDLLPPISLHVTGFFALSRGPLGCRLQFHLIDPVVGGNAGLS
ncbi:hypothetical protein AGR5A_Lc90124 [Agrobacterium genomosp. 5 str. CFBP 6626]|nr:hypothetical protein AGR5A_Lc90124 [Agrobacterium genomosp. 5 str. CFBP 6626]